MTPDLLEHDAPPWRRGRVALVALAAAAAVALAMGAGRDGPAPAAAPPLQLTVLDGDRARGSADAAVALRVTVRNDGAATATVLRGGVAGLGLARPVELAPGATRVLLLERTGCAPTPDPEPADALHLSVRTWGDVHAVRLPLPFAMDADRGC